jgi:hypothetical protein
MEQHLLTPFLHWLPPVWQRRLMPRLNLWRLLVRVSPDRRQFYIDHYVAEIRLLSARGLGELFPDAQVLRERFLGWTKSLVAFRAPSK